MSISPAPIKQETPGRVATNKIRRQILTGRYSRGGQLPTFDDLVKQFRVSRATMQASMRQLKDEGFVRSVHRSGLFVSDTPPHLFRFGLVFSDSPGEKEWTRFMAALLAESPVVTREREGVQIVPFHGIKPGAENDSMRQLLADVAIHRLAGLIITSGTSFILGLPELGSAGIPCVAINYSAKLSFGAPVINTNEPLFYRKALAWLAARGRKRVAVLAMRQAVGVSVEDCRAAGLDTRPHWICPIGSEFGGQTRSVVQLLLDYPPKERPDAIILATDHLVEEALATIHQAGVVIGQDIDVVSHCNWPWPVDSPLPIARLGFHSHDFLNASLSSISSIRRGETPPPQTLVPALFEHEFDGRGT
jgi:DNA-binding LacI/PurR family transcriptional regulator